MFPNPMTDLVHFHKWMTVNSLLSVLFLSSFNPEWYNLPSTFSRYYNDCVFYLIFVSCSYISPLLFCTNNLLYNPLFQILWFLPAAFKCSDLLARCVLPSFPLVRLALKERNTSGPCFIKVAMILNLCWNVSCHDNRSNSYSWLADYEESCHSSRDCYPNNFYDTGPRSSQVDQKLNGRRCYK